MRHRGIGTLLLVILAACEGLLLPCELQGFSVSTGGFVSLLLDRPRSRVLPLAVSAEDVERVQTPEALTLLQLLQGIDLGGAILPPELLHRRAAATAGQGSDDGERATAKLRRVCVRGIDEIELCVSLLPMASRDEELTVGASAFEGLALAMRYDAPIEIDAGLLDAEAIPESSLAEAYPRCFTRQDAAEQRASITRKLAGLESESSSESSSEPFDPAGLTSFDPAALAPPLAPPPVATTNANKPPPGMLVKALEIAKRKGDTVAMARIQKLLDAREAQDGDALEDPQAS